VSLAETELEEFLHEEDPLFEEAAKRQQTLLEGCSGSSGLDLLKRIKAVRWEGSGAGPGEAAAERLLAEAVEVYFLVAEQDAQANAHVPPRIAASAS